VNSLALQLENQKRGGYVGVDVFFVISGFLITELIIKGIRADPFSFLSSITDGLKGFSLRFWYLFFVMRWAGFSYMRQSLLISYKKFL
jgi:hypothetical protein